LSKPPADGPDLVYGLVKIRKFLEHHRDDESATLTFFCDWVLHSRLTRNEESRTLLEKLDTALTEIDASETVVFSAEAQMLADMFSFSLFRQRLTGFLQKYHFASVWTEDVSVWQRVAGIYGDEVKDTPLEVIRPGHGFVYLKKLVVTECEPSEELVAANPTERFFGFLWSLTLNDGRTIPYQYTSTVF
jgi:hypothetical protein